MNNIPLRRALLLALLALVTGSAFATRAKARFDSTHFQDQADVQVKIVATDKKGKTYSSTWTGRAWNAAKVLGNHWVSGAEESVSEVAAVARSANHTVAASVTEGRDVIASDPGIVPYTLFYICTHGVLNIGFTDCNYRAPLWLEDAVKRVLGLEPSNANDVQIDDIRAGSRKGGLAPKFNLVFIDACWSLGTVDDPMIYLAGAFDVTHSTTDRAFIGWRAVCNPSTVPFVRNMASCLGRGFPVGFAIQASSRVDPPMLTYTLEDECSHRVVPKVVGDTRSTLTSLYEKPVGAPANWIAPE